MSDERMDDAELTAFRPCKCGGRNAGQTKFCGECHGCGWKPVKLKRSRVLTPRIRAFLTRYGIYRQHGALPWSGGIDDQPAWFIDAANIMDDELASIEARKAEEASRNSGN